ncbi:MAG: bifunctional phosphoribosylaminoimidazolecarboxamide formyltransferase/IMP cyclohydrolase [Pirellulaceae bacterium]
MTSMQNHACKRAIISVSDKTGIVDFARGLHEAGVEIYSTGGTARHLAEADIPVVDVATYTGFPEMMDGRVKTLHPKIFGGILGRVDREDDRKSMDEQGMVPFEIVCVNLYPFRETISKPNVTLEAAVENIDIGGPSLIRAAAKNHQFVAVLTDPAQYEETLVEIKHSGGTSLAFRRRLMAAAFRHTADYDNTIAGFFKDQWACESAASGDIALPESLNIQLQLAATLRHGENSHQLGGVYRGSSDTGVSVVNARQLNGKQLSYNNFLDMDAALAIVRLQTSPAVSVIKHNNPCGAAIHAELAKACERAFAGDPQSAFGSVVAMNRNVDVATANWLSDNKLFVEVIIAPGFDAEALEILKTKPKWKANVRLMEVGPIAGERTDWEIRTVQGGALVQSVDSTCDDQSAWNVVTSIPVSESLRNELAFGWDMVRFVKSNAITLSKECSLIGVGAGQMSRVDSVKIAIEKAGERAKGSVLASDAFFPFPDSIPLAAEAGVAAIIQPGGSVNDEQVIAAANEHGIPMIFTGRRQFKH